MTKITQIDDRSAATAWCPIRSNADVIALGAKDSGGAGFEETGGELELYDLNLSGSAGGNQPALLGSVKTQSRFSSLGWSSGSPGGQYAAGVLAGGMENGTVNVWNPHAVINNENSLIASFSKHASGPVKALQFNGLNPTQLATGGSDGQVLIANLEQSGSVFSPSDTTQQRTQITSLGWNTQVAHILASAAADGTVSIWDLNSRKAWCELRAETAGQAVSSIAWNPTQGLHLLTASADDRNPVIKLWDLRASTSMPLATLAGHTQGILSMSWCPHDDHLLLSCGKDNRTILWDLYTLQPIIDLPNDVPEQVPENTGSGQEMFAAGGLASSQQRRFDVQWSPIKRGVASTCSLDRKVQAHSILSLSSKTGRPPKWMRPSSSVSCGFGGSVVSCGATDKLIRMRTIVEQKELAKVSTDFESAIESTSVTDFCQNRAATAQDPGERQLWTFMQVIFETNARQELLGMLGFDPSEIAAKAAEYTEDDVSNGVDSMSLNGKNSSGMSVATQDVIRKALLVGDFEAAVECCFRTGNLADALVLASCGGADLWTKTQARYFQSESPKRPFLSIVSAIVRNELADMVQNSDPEKWPETLAILSTYAKSEEFAQLCMSLGDLLENAGDSRSASLCYMCSLSLDRAVKFWRAQLNAANKKKGELDLLALHEYVVKVSVFLKAVGSTTKLEAEDADLFSEYAEKLAEQGLLVTAAKYSRGESTDGKILQDRLYRSKASPNCLAAMGGNPPEFPFTLSDVRKTRVQRSAQQPSSNSYSQQQAYTEASKQTASTVSSTNGQTTQKTAPDSLPSGWSAHVDPTSGQTYYYNQTTGETTWEKPQAARASTPEPAQHQPVASSTASTATPSRTARLASKYGDGFVTSASHPELADQYGNVGTSNPYNNTKRPGTAKVAREEEKAPISGTLDLDKLNELKEEHYPIRDILLGLIEALKNTELSGVDKRLIAESEKAVAVLLKRLARGDISDEISEKVLTLTQHITSYDFGAAQSVQTGLVNNDWKEHKDWLKGIKALLQLARKTWQR